LKFGAIVKNRNMYNFVIPMKMGIQCFQIVARSLDSRFRGNDDFLRDHQK